VFLTCCCSAASRAPSSSARNALSTSRAAAFCFAASSLAACMCTKRISLFECAFPMLSRACLGKRTSFRLKWSQKGVLRTAFCFAASSLAATMADTRLCAETKCHNTRSALRQFQLTKQNKPERKTEKGKWQNLSCFVRTCSTAASSCRERSAVAPAAAKNASSLSAFPMFVLSLSWQIDRFKHEKETLKRRFVVCTGISCGHFPRHEVIRTPRTRSHSFL
jgi:hypothetical protein